MPCLRIAYDGSSFSGSQRQPNGNTVENSIIDSMIDMGAIENTSELEMFRMASRTDRGVSARENLLNVAIAGKDLSRNNILKRLNNALSSVWITGFSSQSHSRPIEKTYNYYLMNRGYDQGALNELCDIFSGTNNYSSFSKHNPQKDPVRTITVDYFINDYAVVLSFKGMGFLWQMCRRIASAFIMNLKGDLGIEDMRAMLYEGASSNIASADPLNLVLAKIDCGLVFEPVNSGIEHMKDHYAMKGERALLDHAIYSDAARSKF